MGVLVTYKTLSTTWMTKYSMQYTVYHVISQNIIFFETKWTSGKSEEEVTFGKEANKILHGDWSEKSGSEWMDASSQTVEVEETYITVLAVAIFRNRVSQITYTLPYYPPPHIVPVFKSPCTKLLLFVPYTLFIMLKLPHPMPVPPPVMLHSLFPFPFLLKMLPFWGTLL